MKYFYSPTNNSFYPEDIKDLYDISGTWSSDAIEVGYTQFQEFSLNIAPPGKIRSFTEGLGLYWADTPAPSEVELIVAERDWRDQELTRADEELNKVQDADPKAKGTVSDWRDYRKALRNYPNIVGFPDKKYRPNSPH